MLFEFFSRNQNKDFLMRRNTRDPNTMKKRRNKESTGKPSDLKTKTSKEEKEKSKENFLVCGTNGLKEHLHFLQTTFQKKKREKFCVKKVPASIVKT